MTVQRRFSRGFSRGPRRLTSWSLGPGGNDIDFDSVTFTSTSASILGAGVTPAVPHLTVVRIRGMLDFRLITTDVVRGGFTWAAGLGIVANDAFLVGTSALPQPFDEVGWPGWLWHNFGVMKSTVGALATSSLSAPSERIEIDTKAMRKLRQNEVLFMIVQVGEASGSASTMDVTGVTRVLVKLP